MSESPERLRAVLEAAGVPLEEINDLLGSPAPYVPDAPRSIHDAYIDFDGCPSCREPKYGHKPGCPVDAADRARIEELGKTIAGVIQSGSPAGTERETLRELGDRLERLSDQAKYLDPVADGGTWWQFQIPAARNAFAGLLGGSVLEVPQTTERETLGELIADGRVWRDAEEANELRTRVLEIEDEAAGIESGRALTTLAVALARTEAERDALQAAVPPPASALTPLETGCSSSCSGVAALRETLTRIAETRIGDMPLREADGEGRYLNTPIEWARSLARAALESTS